MRTKRAVRRRSRRAELLEARALLATITVTSLADNFDVDGEVTLREALFAANEDTSIDGSETGSGEDTIEFASGLTGTISLDASRGVLTVTDDLTIAGHSVTNTTIDGGGTTGVFEVGAEGIRFRLFDVHVSNAIVGLGSSRPGVRLIVRDSMISGSESGIDVSNIKDIVVRDSTIDGNKQGIRISSSLRLRVENSEVTDNISTDGSVLRGAGIYAFRTNVTVEASTVSGNSLTADGSGGGIFLREADYFRISGSVIANNSVLGTSDATGGGLSIHDSDGSFALSAIHNNSVSATHARGGGVYVSRTDDLTTSVNVYTTTISENEASGNSALGGGLYLQTAEVEISASALHGNQVTVTNGGTGAGLFGADSELDILNSTLSDNRLIGSSAAGAAIALTRIDRTAIRNSTVTNHSTGVRISGGFASRDLLIRSTLLSNDALDLKISGGGHARVEHSFISSNEDSKLAAAGIDDPDEDGNMVGTKDARLDPKIKPLEDNGGTTLSHAPLPDSPLISAGDATGVGDFDQRHNPFQRSTGAGPEIGAIEYGDVFLNITANDELREEADSAMFTVRLIRSATLPVSLEYQAVDYEARASEDYEATTGTLDFVTGDEVFDITVPLVDDDLPEYAESFSLKVTHSTLGVAYQTTFAGILADFDLGINLTPLPDLAGRNLLTRGDASDDSLQLTIDGAVLVADYNGATSSYVLDEIDGYEAFLRDGDNSFLAPSNLPGPMMVHTGNGEDLIETGSGADSISSGRGADTVRTSAGNDWIITSHGGDLVESGAGNDHIEGKSGRDTLLAGEGDDTVSAGNGNDRVDGGAGNDLLRGERGNDRLEGGAGDDRIIGSLGTNKYLGEENWLSGSSGNDRLIASSKDWVTGGGGNDTLLSTRGEPTLIGGSGHDELGSNGGWLRGESGRDTLKIGRFAEGITASGGSGGDLILSRSGATNTLDGGSGDDTLISGDGPDFLLGGDGEDRLEGGSASDTLNGGAGNDTLLGQSGDDEIDGSLGDDSAVGGNGGDLLLGRDGDDSLSGGSGPDTIVGHAGRDLLRGENGADSLAGSGDDDTLNGGADDDTVRGGSGADSLLGGAGNDILLGADGEDLLLGRAGWDILVGGAAADELLVDDGEDILIAGTTSLNAADLGLVLAEWTSERSQPTRAANIRDGSGSADRLNGDAFLSLTTISNDSVPDRLTGGVDPDWFFARTGSDTLLDRQTDELFDEI